MTVRENDIGLNFVVNADFDLSNNTELRMVFKQPDGTIITKLSADGVTAPSVPITVTINGASVTFAANEYWLYPSESGLLTPAGTGWQIHGEYLDSSPKDLAGDIGIFDVISRT